MRLIFFGSGAFGLPSLEVLSERHEVSLVVTQPDRPAGRKRRMTPTPVAEWAQNRGLDVLKPVQVNDDASLDRIRSVKADANIVIAFGQKIGPEVIQSPTRGAVATMNLHASLLPRYRGAAPIQWAMIRQESQTGNAVFALTDRMDAGDVLGIGATAIDPAETAGELHDRLAQMGPALLVSVLEDLESGKLAPQAQDESGATDAPKLARSDGQVDWHCSADEIRCRIHGLTPWPGVSVWWSAIAEGARQPLLLRRVATEASSGQPGQYLGDGVVAAGNGAVRLLQVQEPGKRVMEWEEFVRGRSLDAGAQFHRDEA